MKIDFDKNNGLVPAIIQDEQTGVVLMLGYMNEESLQVTRETGNVTFFSRSKQRLWIKGETSGNFLKMRSITVDCDQDTLLVKVDPVGPACHTGADTCFNEDNHETYGFLSKLAQIIADRKQNPVAGSYTSDLFARGINKVAQKVGEEAVELVIEAKDNNDDLFKNEAADLIYHLLILLEAKEISLSEVVEILKNRHKAK